MFKRLFAVLVVTVLALAGCGNSDDALPAANTQVPVDVTITDPDFGLTIKATDMVRNVDPKVPGDDLSPKKMELVAVKFEVATGTKYNGEFNPVSLSIVTDLNGKENRASAKTGTPSEETLKAAGRAPLPIIQDGDSGSGWVLFYVPPKGTPDMTLRYRRLATDVLGTSRTIPAKDFDVVLIGSPITAPADK